MVPCMLSYVYHNKSS
uniref:Uncharacterized protein n=1 Tax=Strongyloides stercoralis TaxID=6248 RepID=A0A0K0DZF4_STRER